VASGVPSASLRLVYVRAMLPASQGLPARSQAHMVLAHYEDRSEDPLILDNLVPEIRRASLRSDLTPVFSFNGEGLWHGAGAQTAGDRCCVCRAGAKSCARPAPRGSNENQQTRRTAMSMIRQIGLIILAVVLLAIGGSVAVGVWSTRQVLQQQWQLRNADSATLMALALSQHHGDMPLMELVLSAQFDTGHYLGVRLVAPDGNVLFDRRSPPSDGGAPAWFVEALPMSAPPGTGFVTDGWRTVGKVEVEGQSGWVYDNLWASLWRGTGWLVAIGALALALAAAAVGRWRKGLEDVVAQARALEDGRFEEIVVPATPELHRLASGMNSMVRRLRDVFDSQASQLDALRRQVQTDPLTGLSNRRHFMAQLERALQGRPDEGESPHDQVPPRGGLLLVRLRDLESLNAAAGHEVVARLLAAVGDVLSTYPKRVEGAFAGRLNGGDLALYLPASGLVAETAKTLSDTLGTALSTIDRAADVAVGGVDGLTDRQRVDRDVARRRSAGAGRVPCAAGPARAGSSQR
jgi:GGDEF domain-containing protein